MIFAICEALAGVIRVPTGGNDPPDRMTIQPAPVLAGRVKLPLNVAPAWSTISSPGWALLIAVWRSPPPLRLSVRPVSAGYRVSRYTRGNSDTSGALGTGCGRGGAVSVTATVSAFPPVAATTR